MSYEIVYAREFIKTNDGRIVPLILSGSNNCWDTTYRGHWRRERSWFPIYAKSGENPAITPEALMTKVIGYVPSGYNQHFVRNGKWVDDECFVRFFENGLKKAKTLEELNEELLYKHNLKGIVYYYGKGTDVHSVHDVTIKDSAELDVFLKKVDELIKEYSGKEKLHISIGFECEDVLKRVKKPREKKERLKEFYAITTDYGYLSKLTRHGVYSTHSTYHAKQFESEDKAKKWLRKHDLERRFRKLTFGVRFVA